MLFVVDNFACKVKMSNFARIFSYIIGMRLVFASNNAHKLEEVRKILPCEVEVLSLQQIGFHDDIE